MRIHSEVERNKKRFGILGHCPSLNQAIEVAIQVAPTNMSVFLHGESGSGKEAFAQIIHHLSKRKHGKIVAVNCGAIPSGTIDSELFGHVKGAFTGAEESRKGYFEEAEGGTIFLDEIGELPLGAQARLLRVLENQEFLPVGSSKVKKSNVRVIAATHQHIRNAVAERKFREDLYYRINTVPLFIPPLRKRGQDILLLFKKFATDFAYTYHVDPIYLTPEAEKLLLRYHFPGNIRQLKNIVQQISLLAHQKPAIGAEELQKFLPSTEALPATRGETQSSEKPLELLYHQILILKQELGELKQFIATQWGKQGRDALHKRAQVYQKTVLGAHLAYNNNLDYTAPLTPSAAQASTGGASTPMEELPYAWEEPDTEGVHPPSNPYPDQKQGGAEHTNSSSPKPLLSLATQEKKLISEALKQYQGSRKLAAEALGIAERTLYRKIKSYNISE